VFLDSFPFPCGYTLYEAMAAGKPAVLYASAESAETGARSLIEPLLHDQSEACEIFRPDAAENLFLLAGDPAQYVSFAVRLGRDDEFRSLAGAAGRAFVERFMTDRSRFARIYGDHIAAVVRQKAADQAGTKM
jgi:glycosyltransferase involved in cell wall biosynthesis